MKIKSTDLAITREDGPSTHVTINGHEFHRFHLRYTPALWKEKVRDGWRDIDDETRRGELESLYQEHKNKTA